MGCHDRDLFAILRPIHQFPALRNESVVPLLFANASRHPSFIAPDDSAFEKNLSNIEEVKARKGPIIAIGTEGNAKLAQVANDVIPIPPCPDYLSPILTAIPLQLLAYHTAVHLGCDVDKPRNLAKSVTVE